MQSLWLYSHCKTLIPQITRGSCPPSITQGTTPFSVLLSGTLALILLINISCHPQICTYIPCRHCHSMYCCFFLREWYTSVSLWNLIVPLTENLPNQCRALQFPFKCCLIPCSMNVLFSSIRDVKVCFALLRNVSVRFVHFIIGLGISLAQWQRLCFTCTKH